MWEIWANQLVPKAWKSCPKSINCPICSLCLQSNKNSNDRGRCEPFSVSIPFVDCFGWQYLKLNFLFDSICWSHRDCSIHIERECLDVLLLLSLAVLQNKQKIFLFLYYSNLGAVAADLLYKSVLGLCLIISRAARYLPKPALSNLPSVCVYNDLYDWSIQQPLIYLHSRYNQG